MISQTVSIVAVGDLVPSRPLFPGGQPGSAGFSETVDLIQHADLAFGDLEMPLSHRGVPREKLITFRTSPASASDLRRVGFDVLSLANNHSLDYGYEALLDTVQALEAQQIRCIGAGKDLPEAIEPVIVEVKGLRIGFIAFSSLLPTGAAASAERAGLAPVHVRIAYEVNPYSEMEEPGVPPVVRTWTDETDRRLAEDCIRRLRSQVDFLVVSIHWGYGSGEELAEYQQPLGRTLIDAGADVIFGNHVHAIHGIEVYNGKAILYSPGNFIAQQPREGASDIALAIYSEMSPDGYAAWLDVAPTRTYSVRIVPTSTNSDGLPEVARGDVLRRIAERLQRLSSKLGTDIQVHGDEIYVPMPAQH